MIEEQHCTGAARDALGLPAPFGLVDGYRELVAERVLVLFHGTGQGKSD